MVVFSHSKVRPLLTFLLVFLVMPQSVKAGNAKKNGDILEFAIPLTSFASTFLFEDSTEGSYQFIKSALASELTTLALKRATHRQRPNGDCCDSFPSGHTSATFMAASFVQYRYGWEYSIPLYLGATYVGYSRVDSNEHYTRDVIAGAAIGVLSSYYFTEKYHGISVVPVVSKDKIGIQFAGSF